MATGVAGIRRLLPGFQLDKRAASLEHCVYSSKHLYEVDARRCVLNQRSEGICSPSTILRSKLGPQSLMPSPELSNRGGRRSTPQTLEAFPEEGDCPGCVRSNNLRPESQEDRREVLDIGLARRSLRVSPDFLASLKARASRFSRDSDTCDWVPSRPASRVCFHCQPARPCRTCAEPVVPLNGLAGTCRWCRVVFRGPTSSHGRQRQQATTKGQARSNQRCSTLQRENGCRNGSKELWSMAGGSYCREGPEGFRATAGDGLRGSIKAGLGRGLLWSQ